MISPPNEKKLLAPLPAHLEEGEDLDHKRSEAKNRRLATGMAKTAEEDDAD